MNSATVYNEFKGHLETITGCPKIVGLNESYKPILGTPWGRLTMSVGEPVQLTQGRDRVMRYTGTFQIDLFKPLNTGANAFADTVMNELLKFDSRFLDYSNGFKLQIQSSWKGNNVQEDSWSRDIVFVRWILNVPTPV